jgi:NADH-quinone oxidoreductase subunit C
MDLMKDNKNEIMTNEALQNLISGWIPDLEFSEEESQFLNITVKPENLYKLMTELKQNKETSFDYLFCLSGVDYDPELGVVYHLESTKHRHILVVKVKTSDRENPTFDSVCDIWRTAEFHEREVFDFFGIKFNNHPNLKRLFLTDEWVGFPLRKDYVDEINMVIK